MTNVSPLDPVAPSEFQVTREPVNVKAELNETMLSASKGEMAAGPRSIGFSVDPVVTAIGITVIVAIGICIWYYLRTKRDGEEKE